MRLTAEEVRILLASLKWEKVAEFDGRYMVARRRAGYSENSAIAKIEAKLSIMLEAAARVERLP